MAPNPDFQRVVEANFSKDTGLVLGCKSGGRSAQAAALLEAAGFTRVADVRGGFSGERDAMGRVTFAGWQDCGLAVATVALPGRSCVELEKSNDFDKSAPTRASRSDSDK
jgi:hypothetical protein